MGDAGTGKTVYSLALLRDAVIDWAIDCYAEGGPRMTESVFRISVSELLRQYHHYDTSREITEDGFTYKVAPEPHVTPQKIFKAHKLGYRVSVFIDELDKVNLNDYKYRCLFEIIDAVYEVSGQMVGTTNMFLEPFEDWLGRGEALTRRFRQIDKKGVIMAFHAIPKEDRKEPKSKLPD
jgi:hypothetical protein